MDTPRRVRLRGKERHHSRRSTEINSGSTTVIDSGSTKEIHKSEGMMAHKAPKEFALQTQEHKVPKEFVPQNQEHKVLKESAPQNQEHKLPKEFAPPTQEPIRWRIRKEVIRDQGKQRITAMEKLPRTGILILML
mmetsp:Transcript_49939/g.92377  ORF Transcript_49939/g.92377 Transcript_49939/m.92377 type:complete len:135 (+) Transcript_49939:197-601(+)